MRRIRGWWLLMAGLVFGLALGAGLLRLWWQAKQNGWMLERNYHGWLPGLMPGGDAEGWLILGMMLVVAAAFVWGFIEAVREVRRG